MNSIEIRELTREYGAIRAVDRLTFDVLPGRVTGFLGPNGAGKSTTMRLLLGLDRATSGTVTVGGRQFTAMTDPLHHVGALLDPQSIHGGRTARDHLRFLAATHRIPVRRVDEVLEQAGDSSRGPAPGEDLLPGHAPASGHRRCPAGRPRSAAARRADQRARPRRHHLDP